MLRQEAQELRYFGAEPAAKFRANDNQAASPGMAELRVSVVALAPGSRIDCAAGLHISAGVGLTTSMRRASATGTSRFMSANRTLRATRAPPSRQTRATACSRGKARVDRTPEVAQAAR